MISMGENIHVAQAILEKASNEIDAMMEVLDGNLKEPNQYGLKFKGEEWPGDPYDHRYGNSDDAWVYRGWHWNFGVKRGREKLGTLQICIDLNIAGFPSQSLGIPVVIMAWEPDRRALWQFHQPPVGDDAIWRHQNYSKDCDQRLFWWIGPEGNKSREWHLDKRRSLVEGSWFYLVPLVSLTDVSSLRRNIIEPVQGLLGNGVRRTDKLVKATFDKATEIFSFQVKDNDFVLTTEGSPSV